MKLKFYFLVSLSCLVACTSPSVPPNTDSNTIYPRLVNKCPENPIVSFEQLGFPNNIHLLLLPSTVDAYPQVPGKPQIVSSENPNPMPIFNDELYDFSVSPDHKWIYFNRPSSGNNHSVLWISSLDGTNQWPVIELDNENYTGYASWVSDQEIFIIGSPHDNDISVLDLSDYMPFMSVNPFTLEKRELTYLARAPNEGLFYYGAVVVDNKPLGLYGRLNRVDFIYDYEKYETLPTFLWLKAVDPFGIQFTPIWTYDNGKFAVTVARSDGIDIAFNLDVKSIGEKKQYDDVMKRIVFPERLLPSFVLGIVPGKDLVTIQRFDPFNASQGENWFYVLDYNNKTAYDYCFDLPGSVKRVKFSPDGKFVAFSFDNFKTNLGQGKDYISILNLEIGTISYLEGYTLVDWGVIDP